MNYGARVPMTTVALPMVHDSIPLTKQILLDLASIALYEIAWNSEY
jgi:hypothetical protein